jgi:uncharacterized Zn-binding protein involved in type VI secretion
MPPAARMFDMHICPLFTPAVVPIPHVGGPIIAPCAPLVLIGFMPAARVTDMCICVGPPDVIVRGSPTVYIMGLMAARIGDNTAHGGVIVTGMINVLIGEMAVVQPAKSSGKMKAPGVGVGMAMGTVIGGMSGDPTTAMSSAAAMSKPAVQAAALKRASEAGAIGAEICAGGGPPGLPAGPALTRPEAQAAILERASELGAIGAEICR